MNPNKIPKNCFFQGVIQKVPVYFPFFFSPSVVPRIFNCIKTSKFLSKVLNFILILCYPVHFMFVIFSGRKQISHNFPRFLSHFSDFSIDY